MHQNGQKERHGNDEEMADRVYKDDEEENTDKDAENNEIEGCFTPFATWRHIL